MISSHPKGLRPLLLSLCLMLASSTAVSALAPGCDDIGKSAQPRIKPNTTVDIVFGAGKSGPPEYAAAMTQAIAELSQQIDGIKLRLVAAEGDNVSIVVNVESLHPSDVGNYKGYPASDTSLYTGILNIYKDQTGGSCNGLCLDPVAPGYQAAIKGVFVHELLHALGADHSGKANVMYREFEGKNNMGNPDMNLPCVLPRLQLIMSHYSSTPPYVCT
jgi:hypothetical protein